MRTLHRSHYVAALFFAGYGGSACSSQCDIDSSLCQSRKIELRNPVIDKTTSQLVIHIDGGLLPSPKFARLLAPVKAGVSTPKLVDMEAKPGAADGDYTIDLKDNIAKLSPGCSYYLNVFQTDPDYQIVDNICRYPVSMVSRMSPWVVLSASPAGPDSRELWMYSDKSIVVKQLSLHAGEYRAGYLFFNFDGNARANAAMSDVQILSDKSLAYFRNSKGILAHYFSSSPSTNPKIFRPTFNGTSFVMNNVVSEMKGFGELIDISTDGDSTFFVAVPSSGKPTAWNAFATTSGQLTQREILMGNQDIIKKIAILKQDADALPDFIAFDKDGNPQVFLQQADQKFAYNEKLTAARNDLGTGAISALAVGDIDGNGIDDLAIVRPSVGADTVQLYIRQTDGSFALDATVTHSKPITAVAIGAVARLPGAMFNNLVVLDETSTISVYQHAAPDVCSFTAVDCYASPAIENRPLK